MQRAVTKGLLPRAHLRSFDGRRGGFRGDHLRLVDDALHGPHLSESVGDKLVGCGRVGKELAARRDIAVVAAELPEGFDEWHSLEWKARPPLLHGCGPCGLGEGSGYEGVGAHYRETDPLFTEKGCVIGGKVHVVFVTDFHGGFHAVDQLGGCAESPKEESSGRN